MVVEGWVVGWWLVGGEGVKFTMCQMVLQSNYLQTRKNVVNSLFEVFLVFTAKALKRYHLIDIWDIPKTAYVWVLKVT